MRRAMRALLVAALVGVGACKDSGTPVDPAAEAALVGTFNLTTVNGFPVPHTFATTATSEFSLVSGHFLLEANHDFTEVLVSRETIIATGATDDGVDIRLGRWALRRDSVRFTYPGLGIRSAGLSGQQLTLMLNGLTLVYSK